MKEDGLVKGSEREEICEKKWVNDERNEEREILETKRERLGGDLREIEEEREGEAMGWASAVEREREGG